MGICCKGNNDDNDLEYIPIPQNKIENKKKNNKQFSFLDSQNQSGYINGIENIHKVATDFKQNENQIQISNIPLDKNLYISKNKLKLIIKQSKCLLEGKEYIINSLGLIDSKNKNNYQDGIVIFGDINVS